MLSSAVAEPEALPPALASSRVRGKVKPRHVDAYRSSGFLVYEDAFAPEEVEALRRETAKLCRGEYGAIRSGRKDAAEAAGGGQAGAVAPVHSQLSDEEVQRRYLCIHFPHKISPLMQQSMSHPRSVEVLTQVIGPNVKCMQSMLFIKAAGKPGQAWHQDEYYIPTRDRSLAGGWIALDDATVENGCLWVIPGSHRHGVLWPQRVHGDRRFDCAGEALGFPYTDEDAIPVEVKAGAVVFFNGYLLHRSLPNRARAGFRRALVHHYMSAESLLPWHLPREGQSMGTADVRDIVMVAGRDPYAYKGLEDLHKPHVRPSGEGGCGDPKLNLKSRWEIKSKDGDQEKK